MNAQINALLGQSIHHFEQGNLDAAEQLLMKVLQMHAKNFDALHILGVIKGIKKNPQEAIRLFKKAIAIDANHHFVQFNLAKALAEIGRDEESMPHHKKAVQLAPGHIEAWLNYGVSLGNCNRFEEAIACYEKMLSINPREPQAWCNYGVACYRLERYDDALTAYDRALAAAPEHAQSWANSGVVLAKLKRYGAAVAAYEKALSFMPDLSEVWFNYATALRQLDRHQDALAAYDKVLQIDPTHTDAWRESGFVFIRLRWYEAALSAFEKVLASHPEQADIWNVKATVLTTLRRFDEAQACFDQAIAIQPQLAPAWMNKGLNFSQQKKYAEAFHAYDQALRINAELAWLYGNWLHCKNQLCDWRHSEPEVLRALIEAGKQAIEPFSLLALSDDPLLEKRCAQLYADTMYPDRRHGRVWPAPDHNRRIRIGYYSADLHNHATAHLITELFEKHDRSRFELIAFSFGPSSEDPLRKRIVAAMDQFIDVSAQSDEDIAALSRTLGIDIAVDLKGYTHDCRMGIFAHGAAPVQVSYLGYPGSVGAPYMDYLVADATLIGPEMTAYYTEKIVRMPHSYQVNDRARIISPIPVSRSALGLPEQGFVFACFNSNYKFAPQSFDIWMRLLHQVPDSVLWIFQDNQAVVDHLQAEAQQRGIASQRLIFAPFMEPALHLARHRAADLFLDTFHCNAHTTASDALWAGLPVLTRLGQTFSARVAASLLQAVGLADLITRNDAQYEALALQLANNREMLAGYRQQLADTRLSSPLFDSQLFARHLEQAYQTMHQKRLAGLPPDHIDVPASSAAY